MRNADVITAAYTTAPRRAVLRRVFSARAASEAKLHLYSPAFPGAASGMPAGGSMSAPRVFSVVPASAAGEASRASSASGAEFASGELSAFSASAAVPSFFISSFSSFSDISVTGPFLLRAVLFGCLSAR